MNEFDLIEKYFKPLTNNLSGAEQLTNDAATLDIPEGQQLVVTKDILNAGVHFIGDEDPALMAQKALRVNLSDLAAMGATPYCYFLGIAMPEADEAFVTRFTHGLAQDQGEFSITLAGGDTTKGPLSVSVTAMGLVPHGKALTRTGAQIGDSIYVSGTIGDAALGLASLRAKRNNLERDKEWIATSTTSPRNDEEFLINRYHLPQPRITLGQALRDIATSCMDVSDGLIQDLGHICRASNVGATINRDAIPLSDTAQKQCDWNSILGGGDDYELLFTAPKDKEIPLDSTDINITKIGTVTEGNTITLLDSEGSALDTPTGYQHF